MRKKGIALGLALFLLGWNLVAWGEKPVKGIKRNVTERLLGMPDFALFSPLLGGSFAVSPDNKRIAYSTQEGVTRAISNKWLVVVDGKEEKKYNGIGKAPLCFSTDGKRIAYAARRGNNHVVVVDWQEGKEYDGIVTMGGSKIVWDSPEQLHYLAQKGDAIYLVGERIEGK